MIISEFYRTREDDVKLYRIYSDEGFEIQNTVTLECYADVIEDSADLLNYIELPKRHKKDKPVLEEEILDGDAELSEEEIAAMLEEVF